MEDLKNCEKDKKEIKINKAKKIITIALICLVAVISFVIVYYINSHTHIYHDEFVYSCIYETQTRISSISDIFTSLKNVYLNHNGRYIATLTLTIFLRFKDTVRNVVNTIIFVLLILQMILLTTRKNKGLRPWLAAIIFPLLWCTIPAFGETVIWFCGAVNYLWVAVLMLMYLYVVEKVYESESEYKTWKLALFCIFSLIVGALHEVIGIITVAVMGLMWLYLTIKNKKINKTLILGCIFAGIGFLTIVLSPGTNVRKEATIQTMDSVPTVIERLQNTFVMLTETIKNNPFIFLILAVFIIFFVVKVIKEKRKILENKDIFEIIFLLCGATLAYISMFASPTFAERVTFAPYVIFVYAALKSIGILTFFKNDKKQKYENYIKYCIIIVVAAFYIVKAVPSISETMQYAKEEWDAWTARDEYISEQIENGIKDVYVEPLNASTNSYLYYCDITTSISYNHNMSMAMYYGLNSIRLKKNYYVDISLEDVNSDNTDSIQVSNIDVQKVFSFYLLDKEIYDRQAPYKRYKNSYDGGDITLYYDFDNIDDLAITFTKSQIVRISKIKLYTPDGTIFEAQGSEITNYISFENIEVESINDEYIILNVTEKSKMIFKQ